MIRQPPTRGERGGKFPTHTGAEVRPLSGHSGPVRAVAVTLDGRRAVCASLDNSLKVWDLGGDGLLATFTCDGVVYCCVFVNERQIIAGDSGGRIHFLRLEEPSAEW